MKTKYKYTFAFNNSFIIYTVILFIILGFGFKTLASNTPKILDSEYIYLDLALGNITLSSSTYTGYVYEDGVSTQKTGTIDRNIYIYQSNGDSTVWENGIPKYDRVGAPADSGKTNWRTYITNNTDLNSIITNWNLEAATVGRVSTPYRVSITGTGNFDVTIDNLWSKYHKKNTSRTDGGISFYPNASSTSKATIRIKGDNRFGNIFYCSKSATRQMIFEDVNDGTLTLANLEVGSSNNLNYWNSALGASDSTAEDARGIVINGGTIFAGTTYQDNCTAIGAGGNAYGEVTINGGTVTAVASTTGTAIGGGIGYTSQGGNAIVKITGGTVYAYNFGYEGIPAAAIGGGSSKQSNGNASTTITITGGDVYAESVGGTAIGGGSSKTQAGGSATINIGGSAIVTAKSVAGTYNSTPINAGAAIGGGTAGTTAGKNGGNATVNIYGNAKLYTGSIGGGKTNNSTGKIGNATITIKDNPTIQGQFIMAAGAANPCSFEMSGGTIDNSNVARSFVFLQERGGAVYVENGDAEMTGGKIINCTAEDGGALYVSGGNFTMTGGSIKNNTASQNGGAIYIKDGNFTMISGTISNNVADKDGGAIYVDGGNIVIGLSSCLGDDTSHSHPIVANNVAQSNGGALMVSGGKINMYCGNMSANEAKENQSSNSVKQEDGEFNISGGELGLGVNVTGGEYNDTRNGIYQMRYYTQYNDVNNSIIVSTGRELILPNESYSEFDETFDRRDEGLWIVGWSTNPNSSEGAIFVGDKIYVSASTDLYAVYGDEEPIASFVVEIPTSLRVNENDEMSIVAKMTNFTNIAELQVKVTGKDKLSLEDNTDIKIDYDLIDLKTDDIILNNDSIILQRDERTRIDMVSDIEESDIIYSGTFKDTITFEFAYDTGL